METLSRLLALAGHNPAPPTAADVAAALARLGLGNRPTFASGGYVTTDGIDEPMSHPGGMPVFRHLDGSVDPVPNVAPPVHGGQALAARSAPMPWSDHDLAHALGAVERQRPAFARGGAVDPLADRPHFEYGGSADRGYSSMSVSSGSTSSAAADGAGGTYGGGDFGGYGGSSNSNATGGDPSHGYSGSAASGAGSSSAADGRGGTYGGGYSNSSGSFGAGATAGVGGVSGGFSASGSGSSSAADGRGGTYGSGYSNSTGSFGVGATAGGGSSAAASGAGSAAAADARGGTYGAGFGSFGSSPQGTAMSSNNVSSGAEKSSDNTDNAGFGSFANALGLSSGAQSALSSAFGDSATQAALSNAARSFSTSGLAADGSYGGYRAGQVSAAPSSAFSSDGYGTNAAIGAVNAGFTAPAMARTDAAYGAYGPANPNAASSPTADAGFGKFGDGPVARTDAAYGGDKSYGPAPAVSGYGSFGTPSLSDGFASSVPTAQTPSAAFEAGVNEGAALATSKLTNGIDASGMVEHVAPSSLSPSINAAMMGRPMAGDLAGMIGQRTDANPATARAVPGMGYDAAYGAANAAASAPSDAYGYASAAGQQPAAAPSAVSPSMRAAMSFGPDGYGTAGAISAVDHGYAGAGPYGSLAGVDPGAIDAHNSVPAGDGAYSYSHAADPTSTSTDPSTVNGERALTVRGTPLASGLVSAAAVDSARNTYDAPGAATAPGESVSIGPEKSAMDALAAGETADYAKTHDALKAPTQKALDALNGFFGNQAAGVFGVSNQDAVGFMNDPTNNIPVGNQILGKLDRMKVDAQNGTLGFVDNRAVNTMMTEGGFATAGEAIDATKNFISNKMADTAPNFSGLSSLGPAPSLSVTGTAAPSEGTGVAYSGPAANEPAGYSTALSPGIATAAGYRSASAVDSAAGSYGPSMSADGTESARAVDGVRGYDAPAGLDTPEKVNAYSIADIAATPGMYGMAQRLGLPADFHFNNPQRLAAALYGNMKNEAGLRPGAQDTGLFSGAVNMGEGAYDEGLAQWTGGRRAGMTGFVSQGAGLAGDDVSARTLNSYTNPDGREAASAALDGAYGSFNNQVGYALGEIAGAPGIAGSKQYAPSLAAVNAPGTDDIGATAAALQHNFEGNHDATTGNRVRSAEAALGGLSAAGSPSGEASGSPAWSSAPTATADVGAPAAVTGDKTRKADELSTAQKAAKLATNVALGFVPGVGPVLAGANALSGLLGYGTVGDMVANSSPAQVGSAAMSGADHSGGGAGFDGGSAYQSAYPLGNNQGYGTGQGYGALDPSTAPTGSGAQHVDANAVAAAALARMNGGGGSESSLSPSVAAAANGNVIGAPNAVTANGVEWYDPMKDPVVLAALKRTRAA